MSSSAGNPKAAVVTGYPVSGSNGAPPRRPFYPPPADAPPTRYETFFERHRRSCIMALEVFICLVLFAVVIFVVVISNLIPDPRTPEFAVSSACVTGFNLSAQQQQLSASFDLNLTVHSLNRDMRIYYEHVTASVLYASDILSENTLAPFYQGKGETSVLRVRLVALGEYVNSNVVRGIESDRGRGDGAVGFNVRVLSLYRFRSWLLNTSWYTLSVYCDDVLIGFGNGTNAATTGYLLGSAPKKCLAISDSRRDTPN
ncbi:NDR1/HIN1-like protein 2 [Zingiber officinale]|nr:NDR1/HIN1-like protein 2 [Zingiber officinale]